MVKSPGLQQIENHFKSTFREVIERLHWDERRTIFDLSAECGISRDTFQRQAKKHGLRLRSVGEAKKVSKRGKGKDHWAFGLRKDRDDWARMHSERMLKNNPSKSKTIREQMSRGMSQAFRNKPWPQEKLFGKHLEELGISHRFIFQHPIGSYVIDFFDASARVCIEIDSTDKWGTVRREHARTRDSFLERNGYRVVRINKRHLTNTANTKEILRKHSVI